MSNTQLNTPQNNNEDNNHKTSTSPISASDLTAWCDDYLSANEFKDYCPNGLQVDAGKPITHLVTGVTASEALIEAAIAAKADAILVHHGYFWKGEPQPLTGMKGKRVRLLMQHGISLIAYHLPLDAHPVVGNNAQLAKLLGLTITGALYPHEQHPVGNVCETSPITADALTTRIQDALNYTPLHISGDSALDNSTDNKTNSSRTLEKIAICTGAAQDMIDQAANMGCDAFISGEISERTTHSARELGVDYFACGHHATERGGVQALGDLIAQQLGLSVQFIDINNPV